MTEVNPPGFMQNVGATHTAEIMREAFNALVGGGQTVGSTQRARGGLNPNLGLKMAVAQASSPNMSVDVGSGHAMIPGTENAKQAIYSCFNDGTKNFAISASDPSLPRIDLVVAKVEDTAYSGITNAWSIAVVTGIPASSPAAPTAPANSVTLAQIAVGAGVTSIVTANITDTRPWMVASGGILPVRSLAERDALLGVYEGFAVWRQDTDYLNIWNGTSWTHYGRFSDATIATSQTSSSTGYTDLATIGPSVTLDTGTGAEVTIASYVSNSGGNHSYTSFAISGATTLGASDTRAFTFPTTLALAFRSGLTIPVTGLTPGTNTFTMKYRVGANTGTWSDRTIHVKAV